MDGPKDYPTKWSQQKRQISHGITYMQNLKKKNDTNELFYKTEIDSRLREWTYGYRRWDGEGAG